MKTPLGTPAGWRRVQELFHLALARDPATRAEYLDRACAGDSDLRREVEALIAAHGQVGSFMAEPAGTPEHGRPDRAPRPSVLPAGSHLGPYELVELLGAGGMGEVYRARDPRLGREVAVKVVSFDLAGDLDRRERFLREARMVSALNHPNICTIHEIGSAGGLDYICFEYIEGPTLATLLEGPLLSIERLLELATPLAEALAYAHGKGILHRDLKPANIMISERGPKILDFGLGKVLAAGESAPDSTPSLTDSGLIMGTVAYMSPEQALGRKVDERSDIFSLGTVLYEMASGTQAFRGSTPTEVLDAVLHHEPIPLSRLRPQLPAGLSLVVQKALRKDAAERYQRMADLAADLRHVGRPGAPRLIAAGRRRISGMTLGLALLLTAALAVPVMLRFRDVPSASPPSPAQVPAAETVLLTSSPGRELEPALARDGQRVAFVWAGPQGDNFDLYTKVVGTETALRLTSHPAYDGTPAWSPDGRWIAFIRVEGSRGSLLLIPSTGGPERRLRDVDPWFGSSINYSPDGRRIALSERPAAGSPFGVVLLDVDTRDTLLVTRPDPSFAGDAFPTFSPDGETLAFARIPSGASLRRAVLSVVPAGGGPVRALTRKNQVIGGLDWTRDGREIVFSASDSDEGPVLWRVPVAGGEQVPALGQEVRISNLFGAEFLTQVSRFFRLSAAHDADRLAFAQSRYQTDIWQLDVASGRSPRARPLVASTQVDDAPQFSPDGRRIAFSSSRASNNPQIWACDVDGAGCSQLTTFKSSCGTPRWSPDSQHLVFDGVEAGQSEIYVTEVGTGVSRRITFDAADDVVPSWSRDGTSIYFASDRNGAYEVWRMPAAGGPAVPLTKGGGFAAFESLDGREVYFTRFEKSGLWAVAASGGPERAVLDQPACWGYWALGRRGIFFLDSAGPRLRIAFQRWGAARPDPVADVPSDPACGESGLALSPDERTLLYVGTSRESDIVLIDKFR